METSGLEQIGTELAPVRQSAVEQANAMTVVDAPTYEDAGAIIKGLAGLASKIEQHYKPTIDAAHASHKAAIKARDEFLKPVQDARLSLSSKMSAWRAAEERKRQEAERQARADALKAEEERRLSAAIQAEERGDKQLAETIIAAPVVAQAVVVPTSVPKIGGVSVTTRWTYRIVDEALIPRAFLMVDEKKLGAHARSMHNAVPVTGVEFYSVTGEQVRA